MKRLNRLIQTYERLLLRDVLSLPEITTDTARETLQFLRELKAAKRNVAWRAKYTKEVS